MPPELSAETREKLDPALLSVLEVLHTFKSHCKSDELGNAWPKLISSLNNVVGRFLEIAAPDTNTLIKSAKASSPFVNDIAKDADGFSRTPTLRTAQHFFERQHEKLPPNLQALTGYAQQKLRSIRSTRNSQSPFQKIAHRFILQIVEEYGQSPKTKTDSIVFAGALTYDELKEVFDYACPAACQNHSSEAVRKLTERLGNREPKRRRKKRHIKVERVSGSARSPR